LRFRFAGILVQNVVVCDQAPLKLLVAIGNLSRYETARLPARSVCRKPEGMREFLRGQIILVGVW